MPLHKKTPHRNDKRVGKMSPPNNHKRKERKEERERDSKQIKQGQKSEPTLFENNAELVLLTQYIKLMWQRSLFGKGRNLWLSEPKT